MKDVLNPSHHHRSLINPVRNASLLTVESKSKSNVRMYPGRQTLSTRVCVRLARALSCQRQPIRHIIPCQNIHTNDQGLPIGLAFVFVDECSPFETLDPNGLLNHTVTKELIPWPLRYFGFFVVCVLAPID